MSRSAEEQQRDIEKAERLAELSVLEPITLEQFKEVVGQEMLLRDPHIIELLVAHYIANRRQGDPVWVIVVGPPSCGKSELLNMFLDVNDTYPISSLTPQTLLSGFPGKKDMSLLPQLGGKHVILKDLTTILCLPRDIRTELFGQFREIWDGACKKVFGNGKVVDWRGKVALVAGCTEEWDRFADKDGGNGPRFLAFRLDTSEIRHEITMRALENSPRQLEMRKKLRNAAYSYLNFIDPLAPVIEVPREIKENIARLADFVCMVRTPVVLDFKDRVDFVPEAEVAPRMAQAVLKMCEALLLMHGNVMRDKIFDPAFRLLTDSIPKKFRRLLRVLARKNLQTTKELGIEIDFDSTKTRIWLQELNAKGIISRVAGADADLSEMDTEKKGNADRWEMKQTYRDILTKFDGVLQVANDAPPSTSTITPLPLQTPEELDELAKQFGGEVVDPLLF